MGLNDNPYDVPQDIQQAEVAAQRRKHGKDLAIRALDEMSRGAGTEVVDAAQLRFILEAASSSGMDTKRVEQLESQIHQQKNALYDLNKMLTQETDRVAQVESRLQQTEILLAGAVDRSSAVVRQLNQVTEQAMQLREDKKHLMRVLEMYVSKM